MVGASIMGTLVRAGWRSIVASPVTPSQSRQPASANDCTTGARQLKRQTTSVFERQGQRAWTGEHDSLGDSSDVDVTLNARDCLEILFGRGLPVIRPQR